MALKQRQQLSEIGVIPEDWDLVPLSSVSAFITKGATPTTYGFTWQANGIPFFRSDSITENGLDNNLSVRISEEAHRILRRSEIRPGDLLMAITGYVGRVALYREEFSANINQHLARIRVHEDRAVAKFIYYWLSQPKVRRAFETITTGQAYPQISLRQVRDALIPCPIVAEQYAIAEVLSYLDATIAAMTKLLAKKRDLRTATMQRLLTGEERLAGFSEQWSFAKLGDCLAAPPSYGINAPAVPLCDTLPRYIRITDITEEGDYLPKPPVSVESHNTRYVLKPGDIVFARTGATTGKTYLYDPKDGQLVYAGFLILARPDPEKLVSKFLAAYTTTRAYWNWVKTVSMRSGQPGINGLQFARLEFPLPPVDISLMPFD